MTLNILLSTRNPSKAEQIKAIFKDPLIALTTLEEAGISGEAIEDGSTLEENALKKALYAHERSDGSCWCMADDTGLFITALNDEPGIRAARWLGENVPTEDTMRYCFKRMEGLADRSAYFRTAVVLVSPEGQMHTFLGEVSGTLLEAPRTDPQPKMPYSGIFVPDGQKKVWAEMSVEEENAISHRGNAFRKVLEFLQKQ